jgi:hypothetical protein
MESAKEGGERRVPDENRIGILAGLNERAALG